MATEGASGEKPPPVQTLATAVHGSIEAKCEFNVDNLSKPELLTLLSIMEGELEARDLVIEALRVIASSTSPSGPSLLPPANRAPSVLQLQSPGLFAALRYHSGIRRNLTQLHAPKRQRPPDL